MALSFIDVLAALHDVDPDAVGLGELGKKDNYVGRQLKTWYRSWTASVEPADYDDPRAHELQEYFLTHAPDQGPAARRAWRLRCAQLPRRAGLHHRGGRRLGDLHAGRPACRPGLRAQPMAGPDRSPATGAGSAQRRRQGSRAARSSPSATLKRQDVTCRCSTTTSASIAGRARHRPWGVRALLRRQEEHRGHRPRRDARAHHPHAESIGRGG